MEGRLFFALEERNMSFKGILATISQPISGSGKADLFEIGNQLEPSPLGIRISSRTSKF